MADPNCLPDSLAQLGYRRRIIVLVNKRLFSRVELEIEVIIPPLCHVPGGPYQAGKGWEVYPVQLAPYQIAKFPVTVAEYACAVRAGAVSEPPREYAVTWQTQRECLDHPVVCVSWHDAVAYARWLAKVTGESWRLPTIAEWSKAAYGTDEQPSLWANKRQVGVKTSLGRSTTAVGSRPNEASPYGVQDMVGTVYQWCSTRLAVIRDVNPEDMEAGGERWCPGDTGADYPAARFWPDTRGNSIGFRLVRGGTADVLQQGAGWQIMNQAPLSPGENELYRTMIRDRRILVVTNRRVIIVGGGNLVRYTLKEITSVHATPSWGFYGTPLLVIRLPLLVGGMIPVGSEVEIACQSMEQAKELQSQIQRAILLSGN